MQYHDMTEDQGREFLPKIENIFLKPLKEDWFFVEPWNNRELRDCAEFRLGPGREGPDEVLLFVSEAATVSFLAETTGDLYLYGAYGQISVCQMRALGTVRSAHAHPERDWIRTRLLGGIRERVRSCIDRLTPEDVALREQILESGTLFSFHIKRCAYHVYDRG